MSLLDAVQRLRPETYTSETLDAGYQEFCVRCNARVDQGHAPGCPWLALPRIVAALEAAERYTSAFPIAIDTDDEGRPVTILACCETPYREGHDPDCGYRALVAALKGEPILTGDPLS